jgi:hypothetical protein
MTATPFHLKDKEAATFLKLDATWGTEAFASFTKPDRVHQNRLQLQYLYPLKPQISKANGRILRGSICIANDNNVLKRVVI